MRFIVRLAAPVPFVLVAACQTTPSTTGSISADTGRPVQSGTASWYQTGRRTANGEPFDPNQMTAAHPSLPFGTRLRVVHEESGRSVVVRINDRGPFTRGRVIDLARAPAQKLGLMNSGTAFVSLHRID